MADTNKPELTPHMREKITAIRAILGDTKIVLPSFAASTQIHIPVARPFSDSGRQEGDELWPTQPQQPPPTAINADNTVGQPVKVAQHAPPSPKIIPQAINASPLPKIPIAQIVPNQATPQTNIVPTNVSPVNVPTNPVLVPPTKQVNLPTPTNAIVTSTPNVPVPPPNAIPQSGTPPNPPPSEPEVESKEEPKLPDKDHSTQRGRHYRERTILEGGSGNADWVAPAIGLLGDITERRSKQDGKFPGSSDTISSGTKSTDNSELTSVMKDLLAAIKKLTDVIGNMGGAGGGGSNMQKVQPNPQATFNLLKQAVNGSGNQMLGRQSGVGTASPGPLTPGGVAQSAGAAPTQIQPSYTGGGATAYRQRTRAAQNNPVSG